MSGEIVLAPIVPVAVGVVAVAAIGSLPFIAGGMLASGIKSIVDKQVDAAVRKMEEKESEIAEWIQFQKLNEKKMAALRDSHATAQATLDRLLSAGLSERRNDTAGTGPTSAGYYSLQRDNASAKRKAVELLLSEIQQILVNIPSSVASDTDSPFPKLQEQVERLKKKAESTEPPRPEEIQTLHATIQRTTASYLDSNERKRQTLREFMIRLKKLLFEVETWRDLSSIPEHISGIDSLLAELKSLMQSNAIRLDRLDFMEKRLANLKTSIEGNLTQIAFRNTLAGSVTRNLDEMGYQLVQDFPDSGSAPVMTAATSIPGGERLQIIITHDNRLAFQVAHEAVQRENGLSSEQKKLFRAQEKKWCKDMPELLRRLTSEGFLYGIQHEKDVREEGIRTVIVEDVESILTSRDEEKKRKQEARKADEKRRKRALELANRKRRM